eukprot:2734761-Rhodomonas_salina.1
MVSLRASAAGSESSPHPQAQAQAAHLRRCPLARPVSTSRQIAGGPAGGSTRQEVGPGFDTGSWGRKGCRGRRQRHEAGRRP